MWTPPGDTVQTSRGKPGVLPRTPAGFTAPPLDGYGLRGSLPARPDGAASYPVPVRQAASLLHASFRPRLTTTPLRFASASPPSGCTGDFHPQDAGHARHTGPPPASASRRRSASSLTRPDARAPIMQGFKARSHPGRMRAVAKADVATVSQGMVDAASIACQPSE
jgi:hypothetical protein